ncbi:MAG: zf-TFIIB domain-containing protein [Deltaproteobacteria bacterium]|nr:zf-TFIIB domain-containing protein [Deltaproteobacteria bacterium]
MGTCPACVAMPLEDYEATPGVIVELCPHCRGLFLDRDEIRKLVGRGKLADATEVVPILLGEEVTMRCPTCVDPAMQPLELKAPNAGDLWQCRACGGSWLPEGAFFALARALSAKREAAGGERATGRVRGKAKSGRGTQRLAHSRSSFDMGLENLIGVPLVLLPLPDKIRWDFWRWVAIIPGALCFTHAMKLWRTVVSDVSQMPWGSALGNDSDGDMNRLVQQFGWGANELAEFYLRTGYLCIAAITAAYTYAIWRQKRQSPGINYAAS